LPENVATDILQQDGLAHLVLPRQDKPDRQIAHSKTSECYLQAWAWARRAGSAQRA